MSFLRVCSCSDTAETNSTERAIVSLCSSSAWSVWIVTSCACACIRSSPRDRLATSESSVATASFVSLPYIQITVASTLIPPPTPSAHLRERLTSVSWTTRRKSSRWSMASRKACLAASARDRAAALTFAAVVLLLLELPRPWSS